MHNLYQLFNNKASLYSANRPSYSSNVIQFLKNDLCYSAKALGADIGCGTGKLTKILAEFFFNIYAVEPNDSMMEECKKYLHDFNNIHYVNRCAENTEIENSTLDYITVAQAFHLFQNINTLQEFKRILKPEGYLIIIYNMKRHSSDLFIKTEKVISKYCPLYRRDFHAREFMYDSFQNYFTEESYQYRCFLYDNTEYLEHDTFINRTLSASYAIQEKNPSYQCFVKELDAVFDEFSENNKIKMELSTVIYSGNLR